MHEGPDDKTIGEPPCTRGFRQGKECYGVTMSEQPVEVVRASHVATHDVRCRVHTCMDGRNGACLERQTANIRPNQRDAIGIYL